VLVDKRFGICLSAMNSWKQPKIRLADQLELLAGSRCAPGLSTFPSFCFGTAFREVALLRLRSRGWRQTWDLFLLQKFVQSETLVPGKMSTKDTFRSNADNALPDNQQV